ncbi:MAG: TnsD family transposase [Ktedonobacteraceae bacterium]
MIGCWPDPWPGELFYSICARFSERVRYPSRRSIITELFGTENAIACVGLPSHLSYFIAQLPPSSNLDAERIIDEHTLLPFFAPFLPPERHIRLRQDMCSSNGPAIHMLAGLMASHVPLPQWLRFCPRCVEEDRRRFGECYWHRIHQVPGVEICPLHKVWVRNSVVPAYNVKTRYAFISAESAICEAKPEEIDENEQFFEILFALGLDAQWLLNQRALSHTLPTFQHWYLRLLANLGLSTYRGRVDRNALLSRFKNMYAPGLLRMLHCELDEHTEDNWLVRLARKPDNAQHPLHHLLLIHCLKQAAEAFFRLPTQSKPFGDGPWPCLNPVCHHYRQHQVSECTIIHSAYMSRKPIGAFSCTCGFTYLRTGPDTSAEDRFKMSKVQTFGHLWEARLSHLWEDETVSLREIARQLGVDPLTIKRHASRLDLPFPRPVVRSCYLDATRMLHPHKLQAIETHTLEEYRRKWMSAVEEYQNMGVKSLRSQFQNIYTWLYRNDLAWLKTHLPASKRKPRSRPSRVDWRKRDQDLAVQVEESARRLKACPRRPIQITISAIGKDIGQLALLQQHLSMLPLTANLLKDLVETREAFAVRRIRWAEQQYKEGSRVPKRWEFIRYAGLGRLVMVPQVEEALNVALQELCSSHQQIIKV